LAPTFERRDSRQRLGKQGPWLSDFGQRAAGILARG
jgi:hypothetical protein